MRATCPLRSVILVFLCIFWLQDGSAAGKEEMAEKLRKVAKLPTVPLRVVTEFGNTPEDEQAELKKHQEALKGTDDDAEHYIKIGNSQQRQGHAEEARTAFASGIEMFRRRLALRPNDAGALAGLSRALVTRSEFDEAEKLARRAVAVDPMNARASAALGFNLAGRALRVLGTKAMPGSEELLAVVMRNAPLTAVKEATGIAEEGLKCMDRAIALAPKEIGFYQERPTVRALHNLLKVRLSDEPIAPAKVTAALWSKESLDDHRRAAELNPESPSTVVGALHYEMGKVGFFGEFDIQQFIRENQPLITGTLLRLGAMSEGTNRTTALAALRSIAIVNLLVTTNVAGAADAFRKIIRLDPSAEIAWDGLTGIYARMETKADLIKLSEDRLRVKDSARNRILLAKAHELAGQWERAEPHVRKAVELEPDDVMANLCLTVVLLKQEKVDEARELLHKARRVEDAGKEYAQQLAYVQGLYWGIKGMRLMAQIELKKAMGEKSSDPRAEEALAVVTAGKE